MQTPVPIMKPAPGERLRRFVGDQVRFALRASGAGGVGRGWSARLRTNLGRAARWRREIVQAHTRGLPPAGAAWRDLPMARRGDGWHIELPLAEPGFFKAKAYLLDPNGWQHWAEGPDVGLSVHPDACRTGNTIYCAFTRLFGATRTLAVTPDARLEAQLADLDARGFTVIPPSGKFRDLVRQLPHIVHTLGCRIVQLLPVNPAPTTYARFGRFGSPYASLDLTGIDPALVEFDRRATGVDQFRELTGAAHLLGARVFLDIVINHTGWSSALQEAHPEQFVRAPDGTFASPGAWGVTWEDLVELKHDNVALWDEIAEALLTWCRRGVDGFRCDAGYKVPAAAWQYITARVQEEFPETVFLLEGLGGAWAATELLLTEGGMQWAYSELFQNYSGRQVANYLDHAHRESERVGLLVHYSETHDNDRLGVRGRAWSLLRNRLCALASVSGGFGVTCGTEWLAAEKIQVHGATGLAWGNRDNIVPELARLNRLLTEHPCFFDGARLTRLSPADAPVYALLRESAEGQDAVLVLVNTDAEQANTLTLETADWKGQIADLKTDLLGRPLPKCSTGKGQTVFALEPGGVHCLAASAQPRGLSGDAYRRARAQAAAALGALSHVVSAEKMDGFDWRQLAEQIRRSPEDFLAAASSLAMLEDQRPPAAEDAGLASAARPTGRGPAGRGVGAAALTFRGEGPGEVKGGHASLLEGLIRECQQRKVFRRVVPWTLLDRRRVTLVPPGHWLLLQDTAPFRAALKTRDSDGTQRVQSAAAEGGFFAFFPPRASAAEAELSLERYATTSPCVTAAIRFLAPVPATSLPVPRPADLVLLTNGIGGMARLGVDLGRVQSKYDCGLGANLDPSVPVDRHIFVKRIRAWVNADGFLSALDAKNLASFDPGPPAVWQFTASAGDGRVVGIELRAQMPQGRNTTLFFFRRVPGGTAAGLPLSPGADVRVTVRVDIEDRNFHWETKRNGGAEHHFSTHCRPFSNPAHCAPPAALTGFAFTPASDRQLRVYSSQGRYHPHPEWCENIPHPVEQSRGQVGSGDAYSPGWFELPLPEDATVPLVVTAEAVEALPAPGEGSRDPGLGTDDSFEARLDRGVRAFIVRRGDGKTIIAGYPWFLDWGRDSLICARGLLAAGMTEEVKQLLLTFARLEESGTLPNAIYGDNATNRDTSDAPLWLGLACEEWAAALSGTDPSTAHGAARAGSPSLADIYSTAVGSGGRTLRDVLQSIAAHYAMGTPNGIRMDRDSGLIWSPAHFTWMDTNHPAGTPRDGYPIEIQVLWIRLVRQLGRIGRDGERERWRELAERALASLERLYWREARGWYADRLVAKPGRPAAEAEADETLRSNYLFAVSLGLVTGERAKRCVEAAARYLVVPGALRSLAPLPVSMPLPVFHEGRLLNHPVEPYWGRYEGDEDTRRKPAYHNGTAWTWTFPTFCEALVRAWSGEAEAPAAVAAARSYLGSVAQLMNEGCLGQIPEIVDGDAPHTPRGCDAQAWSLTEALRVWRLLKNSS